MLFASHAAAPALVFFFLFAGHEQRVEGLGFLEAPEKSSKTSGSEAGSVQLKMLKPNATATLAPSGLKALSLLLMAFNGKFVHLAPSGRSPFLRKPNSARPVMGRPNSVRPLRQGVQMSITGRQKEMMGQLIPQWGGQGRTDGRKEKDFKDYQESPGKFHRFISEDDPTFAEYAYNRIVGYICKTPDKFQGLRTDGSFKGARRVQFTLPGMDDKPKTIELMYSKTKDNPSFGAVRVNLPLNVEVASEDQRVVVTRVNPGSRAENARIQKGDIIRAMSVPDTSDEQRTRDQSPLSWLEQMMKNPKPQAEEGMVILNSKDAVPEFNAALQANLRERGRESEVVLIIERPFLMNTPDDSNYRRQGGYPMKVKLQEQMLPIPVRVDKDDELPRAPPPPPRPPPELWVP